MIRTCLPVTVFCAIMTLTAAGLCAAQAPDAQPLTNAVPDSNNQIIKLTDKGIVPAHLEMRLEDSVVFLLNDTSESLTTLEIDFGKKHMHCAGSNLSAGSDGKTRSNRPFGPRDFASTCFHERGEYSFTVYGLRANPSGLRGTIHVR